MFVISFFSLFLSHRCLVSKLFDVCPRSTMAEMDLREEVRVAWGTGIAGYVAESGEPVNIPDAYQVNVDADGCSSVTARETKLFLYRSSSENQF